MANCYNLSGEEISCSSGNCIGPDCETALDPDYGLEGMAHFGQYQFENWFEQNAVGGASNWGNEILGYEGFDTPDGDPVSYIDWDEAQDLMDTFVGYDQFTELFYTGENASLQSNLDSNFETWDLTAQGIIDRKMQRDQAMLEQNKLMYETQEKYKNETDNLKLKETMLSVEKEKGDFLAQRAGVESTGDDKANEKMEDTVNKILTDHYGERGFANTKLKAVLNEMETSTDLSAARLQANKDSQAIAKETTLNQRKLNMDLDLKARIHDLREDYEVDMYRHLSEMASMGAFVDDQLDPEGQQQDSWCVEFNTFGECTNWIQGFLSTEVGGADSANYEPAFCHCSNYTGDNAVPYWVTCPPNTESGTSIFCN
tara:strand:+ start:26093 stop:27205 length:1113 start_codon:yes stop_codon:yes gene_type:complete